MLKPRNLPICPNVAAQYGELGYKSYVDIANQSKVGASAEHFVEALIIL